MQRRSPAAEAHGKTSANPRRERFFKFTDFGSRSQPIGCNRLRHLEQLHAGNFGHKDLAAVHLLDAPDYKPHPLIERDPETRHSRIGYCDPASRTLLHENGDYTSAAADYISVTRAA